MSPKADSILHLVVGCSAGGKTTLVRNLMTLTAALGTPATEAVSVTTRPRRDGEVDGQHYYFVSDAVFNSMEVQGLFAEVVKFGEYRYGGLYSEFDSRLAKGDVFVVVEPDGLAQLKAAYGDRASVMYVEGPDLYERMHRLESRGATREEALKRLEVDAAVFGPYVPPEGTYYIPQDTQVNMAAHGLQAMRAARMRYAEG